MFKLQKIVALGLTVGVILGLLAACAPAAAPAKPPEAKKLKVAWLTIAPTGIDDRGFIEMAYYPIKAMPEKLPIDLTMSVGSSFAEIEDMVKRHATQGFDVIMGQGFQFNDPILKVAPQYPNTKFFVHGGSQGAPNVSAAWPVAEDVTYVLGYLAGLTTKSNVVGTVNAWDIPTMVSWAKTFEAGAKAANPQVKVITTVTGDVADVAKIKEAALALNAQGADIINHVVNGGGLGIYEAAKEKGFKVVFFGTNKQKDWGPGRSLGGWAMGWGTIAEMELKSVMEGKFQGKLVEYGLAQKGVIVYDPDVQVPDDVKKKVDQVRADVEAGKIKVPRMQ